VTLCEDGIRKTLDFSIKIEYDWKEPVAAIIPAVWLKVQFRMVDLPGFVLVISAVFIISLNQMKEETGHG